MSVDLRVNPSGVRRKFICDEAWYLHAIVKLEKLRGPPSPARDRGKLFHALLEYSMREFAATGTPYAFEGDSGRQVAREIFEAEYDREGTDCPEETARELVAAIRWHIPRLGFEGWEVLQVDGVSALGSVPCVELDLRAPLIEGVQLQAIIDLGLRHTATGAVRIVDWKSTADPINTAKEPPFIEHDYQFAIIREVLAHHGIEADTCAQLRIRSKAPTPPGLTTRKKVMRNRNKLACDWEMLRKALIDNGEDPDDEANISLREHLATIAFSQWRTDITTPAAHTMMRGDLERIGAHMLAMSRGEVKPIRAINYGWLRTGCSGCDKEPWCRSAIRRGGAYDLALLGTEYTVGDDSPLAGQEQYGKMHDPADAYVEFARARGQDLQRNQEFKP